MIVIVRSNYNQHLQKGRSEIIVALEPTFAKGNTCIKLAFTVHL